MAEISTDSTERVRALDPTLRRIGNAGQWLLTITVILFVGLGVAWPDPYANVWQLVLAHVVSGRPGNVLVGVKLGFDPSFIFLQCMIEDLVILFLFFPLLVVGYRHAIERRVLGSTIASIRQTAEKHKRKVEPYGVAGLMLFVIFPFWSTGALVGAFVGYLIGMRIRVLMWAVIIGNTLAVALWVWLFDQLDQLSSRLTTGMLVAIFTLVIAGALLAAARGLFSTKRQYSESLDVSRVDQAEEDADGPPGT